MIDVASAAFNELGLEVFERGWLSSNNVFFAATDSAQAAIVDTGYVSHADQTLALLRNALKGSTLGRIVNTHLHSDHCGGNAAIQNAWRVETLIPHACLDAVARWDKKQLSFEMTDQRCDRFVADRGLREGDEIDLAGHVWQVHAAPGHDPTAVMLFEPKRRVLISADALWEARLSIIFPELVGEPGFDDCIKTLDVIERLSPSVVIPGHGRPFVDIRSALQASRDRVAAFRKNPDRHRRYAVRALVMFHVLESKVVDRIDLIEWLTQTPITFGLRADAAAEIVDGLLNDGILSMLGSDVQAV